MRIIKLYLFEPKKYTLMFTHIQISAVYPKSKKIIQFYLLYTNDDAHTQLYNGFSYYYRIFLLRQGHSYLKKKHASMNEA